MVEDLGGMEGTAAVADAAVLVVIPPAPAAVLLEVLLDMLNWGTDEVALGLGVAAPLPLAPLCSQGFSGVAIVDENGRGPERAS